jgi:glycosyltransferase involved in cell wall biosynthesis
MGDPKASSGIAQTSAMPPPARFWLSVLVPMFKVEAYLEQCLDSILGQADAGVEILICDDCSPDTGAAIAQRYVAANPYQVRMIRHTHNRGISATRNSLIEGAQGEYVWFVDSDDWLRPGAIAAIAAVVRAHRPDMIGCDYSKQHVRRSGFSGPGGRLLTDRDQIVGGICASRKMYAWLRIVRRGMWPDGLRFPEGRVFEDAAIMPRLALGTHSYFHIKRSLVAYRVRPGSILAGVKNARQSFDLKAHLDLAAAFEGFSEMLNSGPEPFLRTRHGASHFIAMEFAKTAERIQRASADIGDREASRTLIRQFRDMMEQSSPIPFAPLARHYLRRGQWLAWLRLRRALVWARPPSATL